MCSIYRSLAFYHSLTHWLIDSHSPRMPGNGDRLNILSLFLLRIYISVHRPSITKLFRPESTVTTDHTYYQPCAIQVFAIPCIRMGSLVLLIHDFAKFLQYPELEWVVDPVSSWFRANILHYPVLEWVRWSCWFIISQSFCNTLN